MQKNVSILSMSIVQQRPHLVDVHKDVTPDVFEKQIT